MSKNFRINSFIYTTLYLIILNSCKTGEEFKTEYFTESEFETITVKFIDGISLSSLVDEVNYTPLETDTSSLIGSVESVSFEIGDYYIFDKFSTRSLFCFDSQGRLKYKISDQGRGPGEYQRITDYAVLENKSVLLMDPPISAMTYDSSGQFVGQTRLPFYVEEFIMLDTSLIVFGPNSAYYPKLNNKEYKNTLFVMAPSLQNVYQSYFSYNGLDDSMESNCLSESGNTITFARSLRQEFYLLDESGQLKPRYKVDFGEYNIPSEYLEYYDTHGDQTTEIQDQMEKDFYEGKFATRINDIHETERYFTFQFFLGGNENENQYWAIYDKLTKECVAFNQIENDLDGGQFTFPSGHTVEETFISVLYPEALLDYNDANVSGTKFSKGKLREIIDSATIMDNPILAIYKIKNGIDL